MSKSKIISFSLLEGLSQKELEEKYGISKEILDAFTNSSLNFFNALKESCITKEELVNSSSIRIDEEDEVLVSDINRRISAFEKVSFDRFSEDMLDYFDDATEEEIAESYGKVSIPVRATSGSAGYDFVTPVDIEINPDESILIPTGIRCKIDETYMLAIFPKSGLGFKYRVQLDNKIGVVDSDYYNSDNEGHIKVQITNDSKNGKVLKLNKSDKVCQGIFIAYGITKDDEASGVRNGGFGSTGR